MWLLNQQINNEAFWRPHFIINPFQTRPTSLHSQLCEATNSPATCWHNWVLSLPLPVSGFLHLSLKIQVRMIQQRQQEREKTGWMRIKGRESPGFRVRKKLFSLCPSKPDSFSPPESWCVRNSQSINLRRWKLTRSSLKEVSYDCHPRVCHIVYTPCVLHHRNSDLKYV